MSKKPLGGSFLFVILGLVFIALIGLRTVSTPEIWTHLAQGQTNAPISFLESDSTVNTTWLYDKLLFAAWNVGAGNAPLLIILNIIGLLTTFILLIQVSKKWGGPLSQGFALLIAGRLIFQSVDVGPQVIMMLFIALFLYVLSTRKSPPILFGVLIPLQILWTNMHGSFLYGPIIAALYAMEAVQGGGKSTKRKGSPSATPALLGSLAAVLLIVTILNPSLLKLHAQVFANIKSPAPAYWSSLFIEYFQIPALRPLILFILVLGAAGLITLKKRLPVTLTTLAIYGAFLVWTSPQMSMLFSVLAFPFIVLSLTAVSDYVRGSLSTILGEKAKVLAPATGAVFVIMILGSLWPIMTNCSYVKTGSASNFGLGIEKGLYPADCGVILKDPAFPDKAINLAADGGYLAFNYGRKVFIDYRPGRYDKELLANLNAMMLGSREAYDTLFDEYRPEAMIINTLSPSSAQGLVTLLRRKIWKLAYFDGTTAILLQDREKFSELLNNTDIQKAGLEKLEKARAKYAEKAGSYSAGNPPELIGSGKIFLAFNRPAESKAIFSLLLQGNNEIPGAWIGLGSSQLQLKEFEDAAKSLKTATELAPNSLLAWATYAAACKYSGMDEERDAAVAQARKLAERNQTEDEEDLPESTAMETKELSLEEMVVPEN
ncbi:MAG: hypothetical protein HKP10_02680 [Kiritimatiellales bacterium]|nr:hypothetical protein [Kiritimatiellales bacterium]